MKDKLRKVKKPAKLLKSKNKKLGELKDKKKMQTMSLGDFMSGFANEGTSEDIVVLKKPVSRDVKNVVGNDKSDSELSSEDTEMHEAEVEDDDYGDEFTSHKQQLDSLKKSDPEFYKYLEENDQELLHFDDTDAESDDEKNEKFHKAPNILEVASDESDYEVDEEVQKRRKGGSNRITTKMVAHWQKEMSKGNMKALREVTQAFHAALASISAEEDGTSHYIVEGAVVFNSVIRMCVVDFLPAVQKALKIPVAFKVHPKSSKNWSKLKPMLRVYLTDLSELSRVTSTDMLTVLLKHIHQLCPIIACFPSVAPRFLKRVVQLWAMDEDVVRVLAFLCALRLGHLRPSLLRQALKVMHLTYVRNTKFVSPTTLPGINFMRQSLCEMFALDSTISYHMAFLYIRQLAIHLRNAVTLKKKDSYKTVYNWAYISSLHLWADLFGTVSHDSPLRSLIYPLVQIIIGTIKLIPSAQFFPLRFHCLRILISMSTKCGVFIPVLPFLIEVLTEFNFNREHKKLSMKPMDLTCLLRCSKSQMKENGFKDAIVESVQDLLMEYLAVECNRLSFPDMIVPYIIEVKKFLKTCNALNYNKKLKAILDKVIENGKFIEEERKKLNLKLEDLSNVEAAEIAIRSKEPPFLKYYESWKKVHLQQQARKITNNQKLGDFKLPVLYKLEKKRSRMETKSAGPPELFPSDEEDLSEKTLSHEGARNEENKDKRENRNKKRKIQKNQREIENEIQKRASEDKSDFEDERGDIIQDFEYSEFVS